MKKHLFFCLIILTCCISAFANDVDFINSLRDCTSYQESGTVNTDGLNVTSKKQILGWENNKCVYKEIIGFSGFNTCVTCKFSKTHLNEIVTVMDAYNLLQQYSNEKVDTSSVSNVQENPVVKVWNKYFQNQSVCSMSMLK